MKAALYARVSMKEEGMQDPDNQLSPMRDYAQRMGWEVTKEYVDRASGGNSDRPEFIQMRKDMHRLEFDVLIIWSLDRFSRESMSNTLYYIEEFKNKKCAIVSLQEPWLDTTKGGIADLLIGIFSWVANFEKERIQNRTNAKLSKRKSKGLAHGRPRKYCPECKSDVEHHRRDGKLIKSWCSSLDCDWRQKRH